MRGFLSAILAALRAWLRPRIPRRSLPARHSVVHPVAIASFTRRYPGRSTALELRRNLGWIAVTTRHSHQDRRA